MPAHRSTRRPLPVLLAAFLAMSTALGLLAVGLALPTVAAVGETVRAGSGAAAELPASFTVNPFAEGSRILAADGSLLVAPSAENRTVVPLTKVAPIMQRAQVAIEDSRFYEHGAADIQGILRAAIDDLRTGRASQGASTLTQQVVKMSLQEQALAEGRTQAAEAATAKTILRKIVELRYAATLERQWTKDQILEAYLNLSYYGDGAYGVEAAARHYFDTSAADLTLGEAATLAGLVRSPSSTDPVHHLKAAQARRDVVLARMQQLGIISATQRAGATKHPLKDDLHVTTPPTTCSKSSSPYFCEFVIGWLEQQPALGATVEARQNLLLRGGLTIHTTLDPHLQQILDSSIREVAPENNNLKVGAAAFVTQPGTGNVLAVGQNTTYGTAAKPGVTSVNYGVDETYGGSGGFQFGSTAKAFSLLTAMEQGLGTHARVDAKAAGPNRAASYTPEDFPQPCGLSQTWSVLNDTAWGGGSMSLMEATARSTNTAFVALAERVGVCAIRDTMTRLGMHAADGSPIGTYPPQVVLGAQTVSPQTLATAYATLAADGTTCTSRPVTEIDQGGKPLWSPAPDCTQTADPSSVDQTTQYLEYNMTHGSGILNQLPGRKSAGKTGTADGNAQSWFVGYTPQLATAVWVGNPTDPNRRMFDVTMAGKHCASMTGACYAAPIWRRIMERALEGVPAAPMP